MTLPASGSISLSQVNTELGRSSTAALSMNDSGLRTLFGVGSGQISMSSGYGKSSYTAPSGINVLVIAGGGGGGLYDADAFGGYVTEIGNNSAK